MSDTSVHEIELDLRRRETEAGWQTVIDRFALAATPKWFEWLGWVLVLAALEFVAITTRSLWAAVVPGVSTGLLWLYFNAFFFRVRVRGLPFGGRERVDRVVSLVIAGALAAAAFVAAREIARAVAATTGG